MARNEYYVDPNAGNDTTGDGLGDSTAWKTVQKALTSGTIDAAGGMRVNVKAGTADVLTASLTVTGVAFQTPVVIQGYTAIAGDGGIGEIDGNATYAIIDQGGYEGFSFVDMKLGNVGANHVVRLDRFCMVANCEIHTSTGVTNAGFKSPGSAIGCYFHDIQGYGTEDSLFVSNCYFKNEGSNDFTTCVRYTTGSSHHHCYGNIFSVDGTTKCWESAGGFICSVHGNTFYGGTGKTATAVNVTGNANIQVTLFNNYVEGFATGIALTGANVAGFLGRNIFSNNTTDSSNYPGADECLYDLTADDEDLGATSGLAKSGADTFANRLTYFAPADQGGMLTEGWPEGV